MNTRAAARAVAVARVFILLAFLALIGAWIAEVRDGTVLGMSQEHLFGDATVLSLLGIALFADAYWHARDI